MTLSRSSFSTGAASALAGIAIVRAPAKAAEFSYKQAHNLPVNHPLHVRLVQMWDAVKRESAGRLEVQTFPNNQLGGDPAVFTQLRSGAVQFFTLSGGLMGSVVPVAFVENVGFAFKNSRAAYEAMDGPLGAYVRREIAAKGLVALDRIWENGMRQITTGAKPIRDASDLAAFKIRTPPGALWIDLFKTLGASPTPIPGAELYTALQTHLVDGQENALVGIETTRLYEVQKYLALSNHMWAGYWMIANADAWKALPPDLQAIVARNNIKYAELQRRDVAQLDVSVADKLRRRGMAINGVDVASFKAKLAPFYAKWKGELGTTAWSLLEEKVGKLA